MSDIRQFIAGQLELRGTTSNAAALSSALRAYLRYRTTCGDRVHGLAGVISSPAHWSLASLPRALSAAEVDRLLGSFTAALPSPRRGYAIVRCALDMGLRSIEVANLMLADIDWRAGTVTLKRTKSLRQDILPLPAVTGSALADYVRHERPPTTNPAVFVRHLAPRDLYNSGARVSEVIGVRVTDVVLDGAACVHLHGKGRKQRTVPLWRSTVKEVRAWLKLNPQFTATSALLPNRDGQAMTRANVSQRMDLAVERAAKLNGELAKRRISPHTVRHTTAIHLLQSGVDISVIALWLGHESPTTTHHYVEADLAMKDRALARLQEPDTKICRYRAPNSLLDFLKTL